MEFDRAFRNAQPLRRVQTKPHGIRPSILPIGNLGDFDLGGRFGDTGTAVGELTRRINALTQHQRARLAHAFGFQNENQLLLHVGDLTDEAEARELGERIKAIMAAPMDPVTSPTPASPAPVPAQLPSGPLRPGPSGDSVVCFPLGDYRYRVPRRQPYSPRDAPPVQLGCDPLGGAWQFSDVPDGCHVVLQCFLGGIEDQPASWPRELRISVNGATVKSFGSLLHWPLIDIHSFGPPFDIAYTWRGVAEKVHVILVRFAELRDYDIVLAEIPHIDPVPTGPDDPEPTLICALTGQRLRFPGRGVDCAHRQCFEIEVYLQTAHHRRWQCPICGQALPWEDLRMDDEMRNMCAGTPTEFDALPPEGVYPDWDYPYRDPYRELDESFGEFP